MHQAPSLAEAPPKRDDASAGLSANHIRQSAETPYPYNETTQAQSVDKSSKVRQTQPSIGTPDLVRRSSEASTSPSLSNILSPRGFAVFQAQPGLLGENDTPSALHRRRASRRRTGPLSAEQRGKAALIRKLGACADCRRRRVACNPLHHDMTWEDAVQKYRSSHDTVLLEMPVLAQGPHPVTIDSDQSGHQATSMSLSTGTSFTSHVGFVRQTTPDPTPPDQVSRTPLPHASVYGRGSTQQISLSSDIGWMPRLQDKSNTISSSVTRGRYGSVRAYLILWEVDHDLATQDLVDRLRVTLERQYRFTVQTLLIPASTEIPFNAQRWLVSRVMEYVQDDDDHRVLKIFYYHGHSYLDIDKAMRISSHSDIRPETTSIKWEAVQQALEDARSDMLVLLDAAFYPCSRVSRQHGTLEILAASVAQNHMQALGRHTFTRLVIDQLRTRATQLFRSPLSAAELHARLFADYVMVLRNLQPDQPSLHSFPAPLHLQVASHSGLSSISISPVHDEASSSPGKGKGVPGPQVILTVEMKDSIPDPDAWAEWLRVMPPGVKKVDIKGPYQSPAC